MRASPNGCSPIDDSPNHAQSPEISSVSIGNKVQETMKRLTEKSPEISSNSTENEVQETVKSLTEKLSAALLSITAQEDLVKQHSKVAEEAVSGQHHAIRFFVSVALISIRMKLAVRLEVCLLTSIC